jgi:membrane protease YdiL (CAAX protease family)
MWSMSSLARKTSTVVWRAILALGLTMLAGGVWSALLVANLQTSPAIPWAVAVMALLLWLMWQYLGGRWWPRSTAETRRRCLRARPVAGPVLAWSLVAGGLSIVSLAGFWIVLLQLVTVHGNPLPDFSEYPILTVVLVIGMASLVTATAEEAGFRGYLQGILEQRVGGPLAILITALMIEPGHGLTQGFAWPTMLFYLIVDVMFGTLAYLTNSILPSLVIHTLGLVVFFSLIWPNDPSRGLVESSGVDPWFWIHVAQTIIFAVLAIVAFKRLASVTKRDQASAAPGTV